MSRCRQQAERAAKRRKKLRLLVTAGPTREYLDPVRYLSNDSSGQMGFAIAAAGVRAGMRVTLVHGPVALTAPRGVQTVPVTSAADMLKACLKLWPRHDVLVMAAAVADFTPVAKARFKLKKKTRTRWLRLKPTPDIVATLSRTRRAAQIVIGFALEDRHARDRALKKLREKQLDAIVLNRPAAIGAGSSAVEVYVPGLGWQRWKQASKHAHAQTIVRLAQALHHGKRR